MKIRTLLLILALPLVFSACSGARTSAENERAEELARVRGTSVEITYVLGHSQRRFFMRALEKEIRAETAVENTVLKKASIDPNRYQEFLKKVSAFIYERREVASSSEDCRSPFRITLRDVGKKSQTFRGCHRHQPHTASQNDENSFSKLVGDGEFLLFSQ